MEPRQDEDQQETELWRITEDLHSDMRDVQTDQYTHENAQAMSRLDRIHCAAHPLDNLDHQQGAWAGPKTTLSNHQSVIGRDPTQEDNRRQFPVHGRRDTQAAQRIRDS